MKNYVRICIGYGIAISRRIRAEIDDLQSQIWVYIDTRASLIDRTAIIGFAVGVESSLFAFFQHIYASRI